MSLNLNSSGASTHDINSMMSLKPNASAPNTSATNASAPNTSGASTRHDVNTLLSLNTGASDAHSSEANAKSETSDSVTHNIDGILSENPATSVSTSLNVNSLLANKSDQILDYSVPKTTNSESNVSQPLLSVCKNLFPESKLEDNSYANSFESYQKFLLNNYTEALANQRLSLLAQSFSKT